MPSNRGFELLLIEWPYEHFFGAEADRFFLLVLVFEMTGHYDGELRAQPAKPAQEVEAVFFATLQIKQKKMRSRFRLHALHRLPATGCRLQMPGVGFFDERERMQQ